MLSRVPLFWLSHKFLCGFTASKHLEEMETDLSLLTSFLFFQDWEIAFKSLLGG